MEKINKIEQDIFNDDFLFKSQQGKVRHSIGLQTTYFKGFNTLFF